MKQKHLVVLNNYRNYGETYDSSINYEDKQLKYVNFGRLVTTRPSSRPTKAAEHLAIQEKLRFSNGKIALCGASIVKGLGRYQDIWQKYFEPLGAINLGNGGDKTEEILW